MVAQCRSEEPPSSGARAHPARATRIVTLQVELPAPLAQITLRSWLEAIPLLERRDLTAATRARLEDARRITEELTNVLAGVEPGEGRGSERTLHLALARDRVQGLCSMFACPRGTFIELLVSAPWNVLGPRDPPDPRSVRGAGTALVEAAATWSARRGCGPRVALQSDNPRAVAFYERIGFHAMTPADDPLSLVPPGERGWSPAVVRVAQGRPGVEERRSPWLVLDPDPYGGTGMAVRQAVSLPAEQGATPHDRLSGSSTKTRQALASQHWRKLPVEIVAPDG
jgi:GNAT superfamily N-acetyltransferase